MSTVALLLLHAVAGLAAAGLWLAAGFSAAIRVGRLGREMDGKSIMGLLLLTAAQGTSITISAEGPDEREAVATLCGLVERGFDEGPGEEMGRPPDPGPGGESCD